MQPFEFPGARSSRTAQAAILTSVYTVLTLFVLYGPIHPNAPLVKLLGSQALARQLMVTLVQSLFWPLIAVLAASALRGCYEFAIRRRARRS